MNKGLEGACGAASSPRDKADTIATDGYEITEASVMDPLDDGINSVDAGDDGRNLDITVALPEKDRTTPKKSHRATGKVGLSPTGDVVAHSTVSLKALGDKPTLW